MNSSALLSVRDLSVVLPGDKGPLPIVRDISFDIDKGQSLAIVGESGCGKSMAMLAIMNLLPKRVGAKVSGSVCFAGRELIECSDREMSTMRGNRLAMIFQDPMSSLNPTMTIGNQIAEPLIVHKGLSYREARNRAVELIAETGIENPQQRINQYPFEFSGGMLQRVMIAMALSCEPALLIADEPTTALDVTTQRQVLELLKSLQQKRGTALVLITHDLAVVADVADTVAVMYAGEIVEQGSLSAVFGGSAHPYTQALKASTPGLHRQGELLAVLEGAPPIVGDAIQGCPFATRCKSAMKICLEHESPDIILSEEHSVRCWLFFDKSRVLANEQ